MSTKTLETTKELLEINKNILNNLDEKSLNTIQHFAEKTLKLDIENKALSEGDKAPNFKLRNATGLNIELREVLNTKPVVLTFYRGIWCPYCNAELRGIQRELPEIKALGAEVIAISPQLPEQSLGVKERNSIDFEVLSDIGNKIAKNFGLVFELENEILALYKEKFDLNLELFNGTEGKSQLPVPATYVISQDSTIQKAYINSDYTKRLDPQDIVEYLETL